LIYRIKHINESDEEHKKTNQNRLAMRYDLTVPFTRYVMNRGLESIKKIQIGRVYRRDWPYPSQGRFCEFIQADYDIVGVRKPMVAEVEIFKYINLVMMHLGIDNYIIRINFRQNLEKIFSKIGVDISNSSYFKSLCATIDKLDKVGWDIVKTELKSKGLTYEQSDLCELLLTESYLDDSLENDYNMLKSYMSAMEIKNVKLDSALARGLDYYTGIIYEVIVPNSGLGSIIAGGRYDNLIYKTQKKQKHYIPAIGVSFGITRIALLLKQPMSSPEQIKIYIVAEDKHLLTKLKIANMLINKGFIVSYDDMPSKNIKEISYGIKNNYNFIIIYGENDDLVCVKKNDHSPNKLITIDKLIDTILENISKL